MPNGGSDCCGTCWFNPAAQARREAKVDPRSLRHRCEIRDLAIAKPFYTYCGNHPHRSPEPDRIPIGPVWVGDGETRTIWMRSPDTEAVRQHLLDLVAQIKEPPDEEYPIGIYRDELIVLAAGRVSREPRHPASPTHRRIRPGGGGRWTIPPHAGLAGRGCAGGLGADRGRRLSGARTGKDNAEISRRRCSAPRSGASGGCCRR